MWPEQFYVFQGATPRLEIVLPLEIDAATDIVYATFDQMDQSVLEYRINGTNRSGMVVPAGTMTVDETDADTIIIQMEQEDTLRLLPGEVLLQIRVKTVDGADTFVPIPGYVGRAQKPGKI